MKVNIIVPAHNEEKRISKMLESYSSYFIELNKKKKIDYEIIVVINATQDRTEEIVKQFIKKDRKISYLNFKKGGKGLAIIEGFKEALKRKNDLIGFVDADLATKPEDFYNLIKNIKYDGIIASRYVKGAIVNPRPSLQRILVSRIFNLLIRSMFFFNYKDTQCGAKVFTRNSIEKVLPYLHITQWAFDVDLLYNLRLHGFKIDEFPTVWADKEYSNVNFMKAGPLMFLAVLRLRIINSHFRDLVKIYDFFTSKKK